MSSRRYDRNVQFFGEEGQCRLAAASVAVVGIGGLGTHVVQQLSLLGVGHLVLIDPEELDGTNRNRYIGARHDDPVPGTPKVTIGERIVNVVDPRNKVTPIAAPLGSHITFQEVIECDYVFGCLDNEGSRLVLTELCSAYMIPYFDLSSDIRLEDDHFGGSVCVA